MTNLTPAVMDPIFNQATTGRLSDALLGHLEQTLNDLMELTDKRVYKAMLDGPLDPDFAVQAWIEKAAYCRLRNQLLTQSRVGHNAGLRAEQLLNKGVVHAHQA